MTWKVGDTAKVNGTGDLMIERDKGWFIGKVVTIVQITKAGQYIVEVEGRKSPALSKRNLSPVE